MNAKATTLRRLGECLSVIADTAPVTDADRKEHRRLVAREYARNSKPGQFAQLDMFKHTTEARA